MNSKMRKCKINGEIYNFHLFFLYKTECGKEIPCCLVEDEMGDVKRLEVINFKFIINEGRDETD